MGEHGILREPDMRNSVLGLLLAVIDRLALLDAIACEDADEIAEELALPIDHVTRVMGSEMTDGIKAFGPLDIFMELHADARRIFSALHDLPLDQIADLARADAIATSLAGAPSLDD